MGASFVVAFCGGRFTSLKLGAFFSKFDQLQKLGERMTGLDVSSRFWRSFYSQKKKVKQVAPLHQMTGTLSLDLQLWQNVPQDFGDPTFSREEFPYKKTKLPRGVWNFTSLGGFETPPILENMRKVVKLGNDFPQQTTREVENFPKNRWVATGPGYQFSPCQDAKLLGTRFRELV